MFHTRFWEDNYVSDLDPVEKLLFVYAMTNPRVSLCGIYEVPLKNIALDTGIDKEMLPKIFKRFQKDKKLVYTNGWMCVVNYPKYQNYNKTTMSIALNNEIGLIPKEILDIFVGYGYPIDTLPIGSKEQEQDKDKETPLQKTKEYLTAIPQEDITEFTKRFVVTEKQIRSKGEDLDNWCDSNGKRKKDYKKFLLNAIKKDFEERTEEEKQKPKLRPKLDENGNPVVINGAVVMETV